MSNPFQETVTNLRKAGKIGQAPPYKGAKAKYTGNDVAELINLIVTKQRGIDYNPNLTHPQGVSSGHETVQLQGIQVS